MPIRIRTARSQAEFAAALSSIGHYFGGDWKPEDLERFGRLLPLDRTHAVFDGSAIVGGAGALPLKLSVPGAQVPCAGVTVVGVLPTHRRRGLLGRMMRAQLADIRERGEPLAALWASEETIYGRFGYGLASQDAMVRATRAHAALRPDLPRRTGTTRLVAHEEAAKVFPKIYDRVRRQSPGFFSRSAAWWDVKQLDDRLERRRGAGALNRLLLEIDGRPVGYALYRIKHSFDEPLNTSEVRVIEALGVSPEATRELWRFLLGIDWVAEIHRELLSVDHPLFLLVQRPNHLHWRVVDGLWLRLVDVGAALSARPVIGDGRVTFDISSDPLSRTTSASGRSRMGRLGALGGGPMCDSTSRRSRRPISGDSPSPSSRARAGSMR